MYRSGTGKQQITLSFALLNKYAATYFVLLYIIIRKGFMKTTFLSMKAACKRNPANATLIRAVVKQLGGMNSDTQQMMENILRHGIDGGFHGFIYYSDTCKFAQKNQKHITVLLEEQAEQFGEDVVSMVANFGVFRNSPMDDADRKDLYLFLAGQAGRCKGHNILNVLAWFSCEEVCHMFLPEF